MRTIVAITICLMFFFGCGSRGGNSIAYHLGDTVWHKREYVNFYDNSGRLMQVLVSDSIRDNAQISSSGLEEHVYTYDDVGKLITMDINYIAPNNIRILLSQTIYSGNSITDLKFSAHGDTVYFRRKVFDGNNNVEYAKFWSTDTTDCSNMDNYFKYDSKNRMISYTCDDHMAKSKTTYTLTYATAGDTTIQKLFVHNEICGNDRSVALHNGLSRQSFDYRGTLKETEDSIATGKKSIVVKRDLESDQIDSTFYEANKMVRTTTNSPDFRRVTTREYDSLGNVTMELEVRHKLRPGH